jgi:ABC-type multidrug transport system fused ATPase/permease subunit
LNYILTAQASIDDSQATIATERKPDGEIEFRGLTFTYPTNLSGGDSAKGKTNGSGDGKNGSHPVLRDIDLKFRRDRRWRLWGRRAAEKPRWPR